MDQKLKQTLVITGRICVITAIALLISSILGGLFMLTWYFGQISIANVLLMILQPAGVFMLAGLIASALFLLLAGIRSYQQSVTIKWIVVALIAAIAYWLSPYDLIVPQSVMLWASLKILTLVK